MNSIKRLRTSIFLLGLTLFACVPIEEDEEAQLDELEEEIDVASIDLHVTIEGIVQVTDERVIIYGETNAPAGSRIHSSAQSGGVTLASFIDVAEVERDGTFQFEFDAPTHDVEAELTLSVSDATALTAYGYHYEHVTSPQKYETNQMDHYEVKATYTIPNNVPRPFNFEIDVPTWDIPEQYGEPVITVTTSVDTDHQYIYVEGRSNLIEGTSIRTNLLNERGMIEPTAFDYTTSLPDGSFYLKVPYTQLKEGYQLPIEVKMSKTEAEHPLHVYGKKGEQLSGEYVVDDKKERFLRIPIDLPMPPYTEAFDMPMTFDAKSVRLYVPKATYFEEEGTIRDDALLNIEQFLHHVKNVTGADSVTVLYEPTTHALYDSLFEQMDTLDVPISLYYERASSHQPRLDDHLIFVIPQHIALKEH